MSIQDLYEDLQEGSVRNEVNPAEEGVLSSVYRMRDRLGWVETKWLTKFQRSFVAGLVGRRFLEGHGDQRNPVAVRVTEKGERALSNYRGS